MKKESERNELGMNRTGLQMSPQDSARLLEVSESRAPVDPQILSAIREQYIADADPLGSVPLPGSVKGAVVTGAKLLTGKHPELLLDKLAERLAFERGGTRIYDALIAKFNASGKTAIGMTVQELLEIRNEEAEHFHLLGETIRGMGGDPTTQTPSADLVGIESSGLVQAVSDPRTTFADSLHAVLVAELADRDGWELLISLVEAAGEKDAAKRFRGCLAQEDEHLRKVRTWYQRLVTEPVAS